MSLIISDMDKNIEAERLSDIKNICFLILDESSDMIRLSFWHLSLHVHFVPPADFKSFKLSKYRNIPFCENTKQDTSCLAQQSASVLCSLLNVNIAITMEWLNSLSEEDYNIQQWLGTRGALQFSYQICLNYHVY